MATSHLHEFHFIMGRVMKKNLMSLGMYEKIGSLSGVIVKIFSIFALVLKREHKWGEQRMSRYFPVCNNPDENREHIHVYFPGEVYREVKLMHANLNCFSIAQLVRGFLGLFLDMVKNYGDNILHELEKLFKQWNQERERTRLPTREFIRQLQVIMKHFSKFNGLISIYNQEFIPFWIFHHSR